MIDFPRTEEGKRNQKWYSGYDTEEEAEDALIRILHELNTGKGFKMADDTQECSQGCRGSPE
ncbi:MAG: Arm DNA-binding domain-containing protein, partial [Halanaerobiales bacterium]